MLRMGLSARIRSTMHDFLEIWLLSHNLYHTLILYMHIILCSIIGYIAIFVCGIETDLSCFVPVFQNQLGQSVAWTQKQ